MSLRRRLQAVLAAAVVPLALLLAFDIYSAWRQPAADLPAVIGHLVTAVGALAVALVGGWLVGLRLIEQPLCGLADVARRRAAGDLTARFADAEPGSEFARLGGALNGMAAELEQHVNQKTLLIREVQHRVMNSLHLLGAILHLHARQVDSEAARRHLDDARERIASMSIVYRHLYETQAVRSVEFAGVLRRLCREAAHAYVGERTAAIAVDAEPIELPIEAATGLALITHELITNAMKHAYGGIGGPLRVTLHGDGDELQLSVTDWGKGLPPDFAPEQPGSLGMLVIRSLTRQLRGRLIAEKRAKGTRFTVTMKAPDGAVGQRRPDRQPLVA